MTMTDMIFKNKDKGTPSPSQYEPHKRNKWEHINGNYK